MKPDKKSLRISVSRGVKHEIRLVTLRKQNSLWTFLQEEISYQVCTSPCGAKGGSTNKTTREKGRIYFDAQTWFRVPPLTPPEADAHKHEQEKNENEILIERIVVRGSGRCSLNFT